MKKTALLLSFALATSVILLSGNKSVNPYSALPPSSGNSLQADGVPLPPPPPPNKPIVNA